MKVYFDCNVILDWVLHRAPFYHQARRLISLLENKKYMGYVSPLALANVHFIITRQFTRKVADDFIYEFDSIFSYVGNSSDTLKQCLENGFNDYEDAIHAFSAIESGIKKVVTRDITGFALYKGIEVVTPAELLVELGY